MPSGLQSRGGGRDNLDEHEVDRLWGGRRPSRRGVMVEGIASLLNDRTKVAGGVIEICSASPPSGPTGTFRIPMIERWLRFEGGLDAPQADDLREEIRENYAPRRQSWEDRAVENTLNVYQIDPQRSCGLAIETRRQSNGRNSPLSGSSAASLPSLISKYAPRNLSNPCFIRLLMNGKVSRFSNEWRTDAHSSARC